jgi:hypothetical protein
MIPLCLMWCIWRERNYQSFEDRERMVAELKAFFNSFFHWMAAYDCFHILYLQKKMIVSIFLSFHEFFYHLSFFFPS